MPAASNSWLCPGCSTLVVYKGYGRRGKYCTRDCRLEHLKVQRAEARALRVPTPRPKIRHKFPSIFCKQCGDPLPKYGKLYCSKKCRNRAKHPVLKHAHRVAPVHEAAKTARNLEEAPPCSICHKSTARSGWYKVTPHPMLPPDIQLCANHRRSFGLFISKNGYTGFDIDEVWTIYLTHLTFANAGGQPYMVMIKEAFHAQAIHRSDRSTIEQPDRSIQRLAQQAA